MSEGSLEGADRYHGAEQAERAMVPDATSKGFRMFHHQPEGSPPTRESDSDDQVVLTVYRLGHEAATHGGGLVSPAQSAYQRHRQGHLGQPSYCAQCGMVIVYVPRKERLTSGQLSRSLSCATDRI